MKTGLPKLKICGRGVFRAPAPVPLTGQCTIGQYVQSEEIIGVLIGWNADDTAIIRLSDGNLRTIKAQKHDE